MKIVYISGISGFIGRHLEVFLKASGNEVRGISRNDFKLADKDFCNKIADADIIINLAGSPINDRWTKSYKKELISSRILTTTKIVQAISGNAKKPELFVSASATGIYNSEGTQDEFSPVFATDFLKELCIIWEAEALKATPFTNVAICRLGIVLSSSGGALKKMLTFFKYGPAVQMGNGQQMMSWIHLNDLLSAFRFIIENKTNGVINLTSPHAVSNKTFTKALAKRMNKRIVLSLPASFIKLIFGEGSVVLTSGQQIYPRKLLNEGFLFQFPDIETALKEIIIY